MSMGTYSSFGISIALFLQWNAWQTTQMVLLLVLSSAPYRVYPDWNVCVTSDIFIDKRRKIR